MKFITSHGFAYGFCAADHHRKLILLDLCSYHTEILEGQHLQETMVTVHVESHGDNFFTFLPEDVWYDGIYLEKNIIA
jgi:hypothetical protein